MKLNPVKTYEDMTLEELEENEDEFSEEDERAIEMYRSVPPARPPAVCWLGCPR